MVNYSGKGYRPSGQTSQVLDSVVSGTTPPPFGSPSPRGEEFLRDSPTAEKLFAFDEATRGEGRVNVTPVFGLESFVEGNENPTSFFHQEIGEYQVMGQLWNSYIVLQSQDALYYIDQHALAERIAFEEMKREENLNSEALLQPLKFEITQIPNLSEKIEELNQL